ncbi:metallophosphoesterase [Streptomyces sp. NPDC004726]
MIVVVLLVVVAVIALLTGAHWYVWRRLVRDTTTNRTARRVGAVVVVALPLLSVGTMLSSRSGAPFWVEQILAWPGYMWLALLMYLVLFLLAGEVVRAVWLRLLGRSAAGALGGSATAGGTTTAHPITAPSGNAADTREGESPDASPAGATPVHEARVSQGGTDVSTLRDTDTTTDPEPDTEAGTGPGTGPRNGPGADADADADADAGGTADAGTEPGAAAAPGVSRRLFVSRVVGGGATAAALATVGYGTYSVFRGPSVKRVTVPLAKLPRTAHGFRIAVVSDIHLGPILGRAHTQRIVDTINSTSPDVVAVVGDMVDGDVADLGAAAEPLAQLRARHGSFFVTGNHEYFSGADQWIDRVRELGLTPLENERVEIAAGFDLAGVDDVEGESEGRGPDFGKALGDRDRTRASVLLAHQPVVIHDAVEHGVDLQLSGHTHGGQLWPGNYVAELANPTVAGLERYGDTQLYVTRGAGAWGPPVRVGAASDVTVVQLAARQA